MHEWALAEAVIKTATEIAQKEDLKQVNEVTVKIGELQQVERPIFRFALTQLKPASFKNAKFHLTHREEHAKMPGLWHHVAIQKGFA